MKTEKELQQFIKELENERDNILNNKLGVTKLNTVNTMLKVLYWVLKK